MAERTTRVSRRGARGALGAALFCVWLLSGAASWGIDKVPEGWHAMASAHFAVYYQDAADKEFATQVNQKAEAYYTQINTDLGFDRAIKSEHLAFWLWDDACKIYIFHSKQAYVQGTGLPVWSGGAVNPTKRIMYSYANSSTFLSKILPHELAHIFFRELVGFDNPLVPRWLDEGVAQYAEDGRKRDSLKLARTTVVERSYFPFPMFNEMTTHGLSTDQARLFYAQAASVVHFMVESYGSTRFMDFLKGLRDGYPLERALSFATRSRLDSLQRLEEAWVRFYEAAEEQEAESPAAAEGVKPEVGDPAPVFRLRDVDGVPFDWDEDRKPPPRKTYLLLFWSIFADQSRFSLPLVQWIHEHYREQGLEVLAVSLDTGKLGEGLRDAIQETADLRGYTFRFLIDQRTEKGSFQVADRYGVSALPAFFLIDADGKVRFAAEGRVKTAVLEEAVQEVLGKD